MPVLNKKLIKLPIKVKASGHLLDGFSRYIGEFVQANDVDSNPTYDDIWFNNALLEVLGQLKKQATKQLERREQGLDVKKFSLTLNYAQFAALTRAKAHVTISQADTVANQYVLVVESFLETANKYFG